ncbi:synaptotagmin-3-like isoform X2, partial [Fagus crenata]
IEPKVAESQQFVGIILSMANFALSFRVSQAICGIVRNMAEPLFAEYIGKFKIKSVEFKSLSLGNTPTSIHGIKLLETKENELVFEAAVRWAGNPNITLVLKLFSLRITLLLVDIQIFAASRMVLKPLVPAFPCFVSIVVSLEK